MKTGTKRQLGFAKTELVIVIVMAAILFAAGGGIMTAAAGNFWYKEDSVTLELMQSHETVEKVVSFKRNVWQDSRIEAVLKNGTRKTFCLDSNVTFSYTITECNEE